MQLRDLVQRLRDGTRGLLRSEDAWVPLRTRPSEAAAFAEHCAARLDRVARVCALISALVAIAWWPLDAFIYSRFPASTLRPELYRAIICAVCVLILLMPRTPRFRRLLIPVLCAILAIGTGSFGYTAGVLGGLDQPWFHFAYPALNLPVIFPLSLRQRVPMTIAQAAGWLGGILLLHPGELRSQFLPATLSMTFLVSVAAVAFGHYAFLLFRDNFLQALALKRSAAELEDRVVEQTHALRELLAHLDRARDDERVHLSRELHDELGQELTALRYALGLARERYQREPSAIDNNLCELDHLLSRTTRSVRALVGRIRPLVLDDLGLVAAVTWLARQANERGGVACNLRVTGDEAHVDKDAAATAFRVIQEALTNVMRHASAHRVDLELAITPQHVDLRVRDDGVGFVVASDRLGMGLRGMRERVLALGSRRQITSQPGAGTEVACRLPCAGALGVTEAAARRSGTRAADADPAATARPQLQ